jgi:nucleotidyltransferase AbiEii toxin of type IV toxin-antitoxin system
MFVPNLDILPPAQKSLWAELVCTPKTFVLYGGTALALRLGHRQSEDFDFFCDGSFQPSALIAAIAYLKNAELSQMQENTLTAIVDREGPVKVSFFGAVGLNRVEDPDVVEQNGILVASMIDLAATKLKTVQQRALAKDYLDIASTLDTGLGLPQALAAAEAIFGRGFNGALSLKALTYFEDGDLPTLRRDTRDKLRQAAASVDLRDLPHVMARPGIRQKQGQP